MLFLKTVTTFFLAALAAADPAPISRDSPAGAVFQAQIAAGAIQGFVGFIARDGYVFLFNNLRGLPPAGGPYTYAVHQRAVPQTGDCRRTLGVFDPYDGVPRARTPAEYRVGDLSGKHGTITGPTYFTVFLDPYLSLNSANNAYVGNLSVVIRRRDGTRVACGSIRGAPPNQPIPKEVEEQMGKLVSELKEKSP